MLRQAASCSTPAAAAAAAVLSTAWQTVGRRSHRYSCRRWLSETAAARQKAAGDDNVGARPPAAAAVVFQYPKTQAMFEKIIASFHTADQWRLLQDTVLHTLGRQRRAKEFYFDGFGGGKRGKRKSGDSGAAEEEAAPAAPSAFDVKLVGFDATAKIKVIKEVRSLLGLGLKEAKELVESVPVVLQKQISTEAAEEIKAKLVEIGAQIELV